ncbi:MAG: hemolysin family protein [Pseudomonadota bacterium]
MEDQSKTKIDTAVAPAKTPSKKIKTHQTISDHINKINHSVNVILGKNNKPSLLKSLNKAIDNCQKNGLITSEEKKMVKNIVNIEDTKVGDVMTPRTDVVAVQYDSSLEDIKKLIIESEHSRIPVFRRNLDNIVGFIHSKDLAKFIASEDGTKLDNFKIANIIRKILYVPHSMRIIDLLLKMRSSRVHIAIVLDEYGGTDGLVSIEDIVEEIVGEIEDEHDIPDDNIYLRIKKIDNTIMQVGGRVEIEKISEFLENNLLVDDIDSDFETVGGLVFAIFKKVPEIGEIYDHNASIRFKVLDADARSVKLVEISKLDKNN